MAEGEAGDVGEEEREGFLRRRGRREMMVSEGDEGREMRAGRREKRGKTNDGVGGVHPDIVVAFKEKEEGSVKRGETRSKRKLRLTSVRTELDAERTGKRQKKGASVSKTRA